MNTYVLCKDDTFSSYLLETGKIYKVLVEVKSWKDRTGRHKGKGYIVSKIPYPYVWNSRRFKIVKKEK